MAPAAKKSVKKPAPKAKAKAPPSKAPKSKPRSTPAPAKAKTPVPKSKTTPPPKSKTPVPRAPKSETAVAKGATPPPRSRVQRLPPSAPEARDGISPVAAKAISPDLVIGDGSRGKYVYCVIYGDKPLNFGPLGIGTEPADVHTVNFKDIAAVVSDTAIAVHEPTRANVLAHERVNETVMRDHTVIPMSFGTVFKTREDIHELLRSSYDAFKDVLVKM